MLLDSRGATRQPGYYSTAGAATALEAGVVAETVVLGFLVRHLEQHGLKPVAVAVVAVLVPSPFVFWLL